MICYIFDRFFITTISPQTAFGQLAYITYIPRWDNQLKNKLIKDRMLMMYWPQMLAYFYQHLQLSPTSWNVTTAGLPWIPCDTEVTSKMTLTEIDKYT